MKTQTELDDEQVDDAGIAGLEVAVRRVSAASTPCGGLEIRRSGRNRWMVLVTAASESGLDGSGSRRRDRRDPRTRRLPERLRELVLGSVGSAELPSVALTAASAALLDWQTPPVPACLARVEQDVCGAWITLSCAGAPLPTVLRRAGWIDARGQVGPPLGERGAELADDRVGLGPGDALVLCTPAVAEAQDPAGERYGTERLPELLLSVVSRRADEVAGEVLAGLQQHAGHPVDDALVAVVRVPPDITEQSPADRLAAVLGVPVGSFPLPGYAIGDHAAFDRRPAPPREARIRLQPKPVSTRAARRFVDRVLRSWRMPELADAGDVALALSELVSNAVRHAGTAFTVIVRYLGTAVRVEVGDGSRALPQRRAVTDADVSGRGLAIVQELAAELGVTETVTGKRVWFTVPT